MKTKIILLSLFLITLVSCREIAVRSSDGVVVIVNDRDRMYEVGDTVMVKYTHEVYGITGARYPKDTVINYPEGVIIYKKCVVIRVDKD